MPNEMSQVLKEDVQKIIQLQQKQTQESVLVQGVIETAEKLATSSLTLDHDFHSHASGVAHAVTGLHIVGIGFAVIGFLRAMNDFLKGKKVSWPHLGGLFYSSIVVALAVLTFAVPIIGAILGVTGAALGLVVSGFHLINNIYKRQTLARELATQKQNLTKLEKEIDADKVRLQQLTTAMLVSTCSQAEIDKTLLMLQKNMHERDKNRTTLSQKMNKTLVDYHATRLQPVRGISVFGASLALIAGILLFFNPFVAGVLFIVTAALGGGLAIHAVTHYFINKSRPLVQTLPPILSDDSAPIANPESKLEENEEDEMESQTASMSPEVKDDSLKESEGREERAPSPYAFSHHPQDHSKAKKESENPQDDEDELMLK